jgi:MerR HTH family regulatory protein
VRKPSDSKTKFTVAEACKALNVSRGTLNSWAFNGLFEGLSGEKTTPGKARKFTRADLAQLAITRQLLAFGVAGKQANEWAGLCVTLILEGGDCDEAHLLMTEGGGLEFRIPERAIEPEPDGVALRLVIYPRVTELALRQRLNDIDTGKAA